MSENTIKRILRVGLWVLLGVSALITILFVSQLDATAPKAEQGGVAEPMIVWSYILLGIAAFFTVFFPILFIIKYPRRAVKLLVSMLILAGVFGVSYLLADATPIQTATASMNPDFSDRGVLLLTDTGIYATYILIGAAILLLVYTGLRGLFANK